MEEVEHRFRVFAKEMDRLREEIDSLRKEIVLNRSCIDVVGRLSVASSLITSLAFYALSNILRGEKLSYISNSIKTIIDVAEIWKQIIKSLSQDVYQALKPFITSWTEAAENTIKECLKAFFDYAKAKKANFEQTLHILHSSFNNWGFLKYISDDVVLETYGSEALSILKKYKETFLSRE